MLNMMTTGKEIEPQCTDEFETIIKNSSGR